MKQCRVILRSIAFLMLFIGISTAKGQYRANDKDLIQITVGESRNWTNTRFLFYTANGSSIIPNFSNERSYLIDKTTGDCRFESINKNDENVVLLFNYKSKKSKKYYVNNKESNSEISTLLDNIVDQFFADTQLLFLPAFLTTNKSAITDISQKILNSDKVSIISFNSIPNFSEKSTTGKLFISSKDEIKAISIDNNTYTVSASKDIGSGILLPTLFEGQNTVIFNTVAAFTQIEPGKFTNL